MLMIYFVGKHLNFEYLDAGIIHTNVLMCWSIREDYLIATYFIFGILNIFSFLFIFFLKKRHYWKWKLLFFIIWSQNAALKDLEGHMFLHPYFRLTTTWDRKSYTLMWCILHFLEFLKEKLETYIAETWPDGIVKLVRTTKRSGLIRARIAGAIAASGDILIFLDSHCEATTGW